MKSPKTTPTRRSIVLEWAKAHGQPFEVGEVVAALRIEMKQASSSLCNLVKAGDLSKTPVACAWKKNRYQFIEKVEDEFGEIVPPTPCVTFMVGGRNVYPESLPLVRGL